MLTKSQTDKLAALRSGNPDVNKPEFYYRVSKDMKNILERSLKEIVDLFDEMPEKSLERIDMHVAAINCLNLFIKLTEHIEPAPRAGDEVLRYYRVQVENPLPGVVPPGDKAVVRVAVTYKPDDVEKEFMDKLAPFLEHIKGSIYYSGNPLTTLTQEEFNKKMKALKDKKDFKVSMLGPVVGDSSSS